MIAAEPAVDREADDDDDGPAFELRRSAELACPVVFASPHSGRVYPQSMRDRARLQGLALRGSEDALVDRLIEPAAAHGPALFLARYARAYLDVNREPTELDPAMFAAPPAGAADPPSARTRAGLGCLPRVVAQGREIYRDRLPAEEAERRVARVWRPFHAGLDALLGEARGRFGRALLVDWHSMPGAAARLGRGRRGGAADIVLGDRHGRSCSSATIALAEEVFAGCGYRVARNSPYAGGWITERYGRPEHGLEALQVEISRAAYLDEERLEPASGFAALQRAIAALADRLRVATAR